MPDADDTPPEDEDACRDDAYRYESFPDPSPPPRRPVRYIPPGEVACTRRTRAQGTSAVAHPGDPPPDDDPLLCFTPYLHPAPRSNSITPERQVRFIATLAATGIVNQAARSIGKSVEALYTLRAKPGAEGFAEAWDEALERGMHRLEDCALERALKGTPTPIVSRGQFIGTWDKPDNGLLRFLLQHRRSERYGAQNIGPGHPVYNRVKADVLAEIEQEPDDDEEEVLASLDRMFAAMRRDAQYQTDAVERARWNEACDDLPADIAAEAWSMPCGRYWVGPPVGQPE